MEAAGANAPSPMPKGTGRGDVTFRVKYFVITSKIYDMVW